MDNSCYNKWVITYVSLEICILLSTLYLLIILNVKIEWKEKKMSVEKLNKKKHAIDFFLVQFCNFRTKLFKRYFLPIDYLCLGCVFVESPSPQMVCGRDETNIWSFFLHCCCVCSNWTLFFSGRSFELRLETWILNFRHFKMVVYLPNPYFSFDNFHYFIKSYFSLFFWRVVVKRT